MKEELQKECAALQHAMQSGVAMELSSGSKAADPKHLRVGVNSAMVEHAALLAVLIDKEIISEDEYWRSLRDEMRKEVGRYEAWLTERLGRPVTLG